MRAWKSWGMLAFIVCALSISGLANAYSCYSLLGNPLDCMVLVDPATGTQYSSTYPLTVSATTTPPVDYVATGSIGALNANVATATMNGVSTANVQITGTFSATLSAQITTDGTNWTTLPTITNIATSATSATITAVGNYQVPVPASAKLRIIATAYTSGSATASIRASTGTGGGGGGVAGSVTVSSSALPAGAATAAKQPALGTAGTASTDVITVQGIASGTPQTVSGTVTANAGTGTLAIKSVQFKNVQTFTRPSNTTAYVIGQAISNSTSAPTQLTFPACATASQSGVIQKVVVISSNKGATLPQVSAYVFGATLASATFLDGAALEVDTATYYAGGSIIPAVETSSTNTHSRAAATGLSIPFTCDASSNLYAILQALNAYTPASAEVFNVVIEGYLN